MALVEKLGYHFSHVYPVYEISYGCGETENETYQQVIDRRGQAGNLRLAL